MSALGCSILGLSSLSAPECPMCTGRPPALQQTRGVYLMSSPGLSILTAPSGQVPPRRTLKHVAAGTAGHRECSAMPTALIEGLPYCGLVLGLQSKTACSARTAPGCQLHLGESMLVTESHRGVDLQIKVFWEKHSVCLPCTCFYFKFTAVFSIYAFG